MKLKIYSALIVLAALTTACSNDSGSSNPNKVVITAADQDDSNTLANAGEALVSPFTFMLADPVFDKALAKDPGNKKALFYKSFLKRFMLLRGVHTRVRPLVRNYGNIGSYETGMRRFPSSPFKDFAADGQENISSAIELQNLLVSYRDSLLDFYKFIKENQDLEMEIYLNPYVWMQEIQREAANNCFMVSYDPYTVECDYTNAAVKKVSAPDMLALKQLVAGEVAYFTLWTSYSVEGMEKLKEADPKGQLPPETALGIVEANSRWGKLRNDNTLKILTELGSDYSAAVKYVAQNQNRLCPPMPYGKAHRPGTLFPRGFCVTGGTNLDQQLALLDSALTGPITVQSLDKTGKVQSVRVDYFAISRNAPAHVRSFLPQTWEQCPGGQGWIAKTLADNTLGGIYPDGNAPLFTSMGSCSFTSVAPIAEPIP